jgi:hypothetical protein
LPPPPQRDASGRLPLPRAQTGRLPLPAADAPAAFRSGLIEEPMPQNAPANPAPETTSAATPEFTFTPTPPEPSTPMSGPTATLSPPKFTPPASFTPETAPAPPARPAVPMPDYKPLFGYDAPEDESDESTPAFSPSLLDPPAESDEPAGLDPASQPVEDLDVTDEPASPDSATKFQEMEEQLALATEERDQTRAELEITRTKGPAASDDKLTEDLATTGRERDEARMEVIVLRNRLETAEQTQRDTDAMASQLEELSHVIDERDSVRRDYASLREQFETLKLDRSQLDSHEANLELQEEVRQLRDQLAIHASDLVSKTGALPSTGGSPGEINALKDQVRQAKEEASLAHRGLALSQKALQETRETLREASEGTSSSKGSLEEMKKDRAGIVRQNMLLQGQNDQLTRELSAAKAKLAAKGA